MGEACLNRASQLEGMPCGPIECQPLPAGVQWYGLKVRTGAERSVEDALLSRGLQPYCPTRKERRRYSDRMKTVEVAAFPGYLFCAFDAREKLPVISSPGVEYILGTAAGPTPIPELEVRNVSRMITAGARCQNGVQSGKRVSIAYGPLQGVEGTVVRDANGSCFVVSVNLLNRSAFLHINEDQICSV